MNAILSKSDLRRLEANRFSVPDSVLAKYPAFITLSASDLAEIDRCVASVDQVRPLLPEQVIRLLDEVRQMLAAWSAQDGLALEKLG